MDIFMLSITKPTVWWMRTSKTVPCNDDAPGQNFSLGTAV